MGNPIDRIRAGHFVLAAVFFAFAGCGTLPWLNPPSFRRVPEQSSPLSPEFEDHSGVFHVHSRFSHDSEGHFDKIVEATQKAGADFVVVTDHDSLGALHAEMNGFYGKTLVVVGTELSTSSGHLTVLGVKRLPDPAAPVSEIFKSIEEQGGLSFVNHGEFSECPWKDWAAGSFTGMEIYNLAVDLYTEGRFRLGFMTLALYPRLLFRSVVDRPDAFLRRWDELLKERPVVGVGSVDSHEKISFLGLKLDRYQSMHSVVQTHVYAKELTEPAILEALKQGRAYVGFGAVRPVKNFLFVAEQEGLPSVWMGDSVKSVSGLKLRVVLPSEGTIRLLRDGKPVKEEKTRSLTLSSPDPGVWRVEVYQGKRIWILSNPIRVTA